MSDENLAFPYTDDFRKAKRNSLLWSGITLVAAMGSPPVVGGESTFGHLGFSLTYSKSVIVWVAGLVAIFMAIGFYQAFQRIKLHANQLFAGETDVERVFQQLRLSAKATVQHVTNINNNLPAVATEALEPEKIREAIDRVRTLLEVESKGTEIKAILDRFDVSNAGTMPTEVARRVANDVIGLIGAREQKSIEANAKLGELESLIDATRDDMAARIVAITDKRVVQAHDEENEMTRSVARLMRFHQGLYRSEIRWFWGFDVAPVALLCLTAMVPFVRLFIDN